MADGRTPERRAENSADNPSGDRTNRASDHKVCTSPAAAPTMSPRAMGEIVATAIVVVIATKNRRTFSPPLFLELPTYAA
jgi:hypothetical protein